MLLYTEETLLVAQIHISIQILNSMCLLPSTSCNLKQKVHVMCSFYYSLYLSLYLTQSLYPSMSIYLNLCLYPSMYIYLNICLYSLISFYLNLSLYLSLSIYHSISIYQYIFVLFFVFQPQKISIFFPTASSGGLVIAEHD